MSLIHIPLYPHSNLLDDSHTFTIRDYKGLYSSYIPVIFHCILPKNSLENPLFEPTSNSGPDSRPAPWAAASALAAANPWPGPCRRSRHSHRSGWESWLLGVKTGMKPMKVGPSWCENLAQAHWKCGSKMEKAGEATKNMEILMKKIHEKWKKQWEFRTVPGDVNMGIYHEIVWESDGKWIRWENPQQHHDDKAGTGWELKNCCLSENIGYSKSHVLSFESSYLSGIPPFQTHPSLLMLCYFWRQNISNWPTWDHALDLHIPNSPIFPLPQTTLLFRPSSEQRCGRAGSASAMAFAPATPPSRLICHLPWKALWFGPVFKSDSPHCHEPTVALRLGAGSM